MDIWPPLQVHNIIWEGSDHFPILLYTEPQTRKREEKDKSIKLEAYWAKEEEFSEVVTSTWNESKGCYATFSDRLQACGEIFKKWGYEKFGVLHERAKNLRKKFLELCKASSED